MGKSILVVDSPEASLHPLVQTLGDLGYLPTVLQVGDDPVTHFSKHEYELVFMSQQGIDAKKLCAGIRQTAEGAITPVIFVGTGQDPIKSPADALGAGGDYYFSLPLDMARVLAKVQTYVGGGGAPSKLELPKAPSFGEAPGRSPATQALAGASDAVLAKIANREAELGRLAEVARQRAQDEERERQRVADEREHARRKAEADAQQALDAQRAAEEAERRKAAERAVLKAAEAARKRAEEEDAEREALDTAVRQEDEATLRRLAAEQEQQRAHMEVVRRAQDEARRAAEAEAAAEAQAAAEAAASAPPNAADEAYDDDGEPYDEDAHDEGGYAEEDEEDEEDEDTSVGAQMALAAEDAELAEDEEDEDIEHEESDAEADAGDAAADEDEDEGDDDDDRFAIDDEEDADTQEYAADEDAPAEEAPPPAAPPTARHPRDHAAAAYAAVEAEQDDDPPTQPEVRRAPSAAQQGQARPAAGAPREAARGPGASPAAPTPARQASHASARAASPNPAARRGQAAEPPAAPHAQAAAPAAARRGQAAEKAAPDRAQAGERAGAAATARRGHGAEQAAPNRAQTSGRDAEPTRRGHDAERAATPHGRASEPERGGRASDTAAPQPPSWGGRPETGRGDAAPAPARRGRPDPAPPARAEAPARSRDSARPGAGPGAAERPAEARPARRGREADAAPAAQAPEPIIESPRRGRAAEDRGARSPRPRDQALARPEPEQRPAKPLQPDAGTLGPQLDVAGLLVLAFRQEITGRLELARGEERRSLFFEAGVPVDAVSDQPFDRIEEYLYREGKITQAQYQGARLKRLQSARQVGAYLVSTNSLKPEELFAAVRGHLEEQVITCFEWEEGSYRYLPQTARESDRILLDLDPRALIMEGIRRKYLLPRLVARLGSPSSLVALTDRAGPEIAALRLGAGEQAVARLLDGQRNLEDVVFSGGLEPLRVYHVAHALVCLGAAQVLVRGLEGLRAPDANSDAIDRGRIADKLNQVRDADYFQIVGVPRTATAYEIERACAHVDQAFAVDRFSAAVQQELQPQLSEIATVLADAKEVLADVSKREAYARHLP